MPCRKHRHACLQRKHTVGCAVRCAVRNLSSLPPGSTSCCRTMSKLPPVKQRWAVRDRCMCCSMTPSPRSTEWKWISLHCCPMTMRHSISAAKVSRCGVRDFCLDSARIRARGRAVTRLKWKRSSRDLPDCPHRSGAIRRQRRRGRGVCRARRVRACERAACLR